MPNTFQNLDVPTADGAGAPFVTSALGRPKTIVFSGAVLGRYIVEGSNDGGTSWDIIVDDDGQQALFTSQAPGVRNFDCIVDRWCACAASATPAWPRRPPSRSAHRRPSAPSGFGVLDVPASSGFGAPFDLGLSAGAFKTFILRGAIPAGSRYIDPRLDGRPELQEVMLFTSDQQGARPAALLCRFLRVQRDAAGPTPVIAFGSEGIFEPTSVATSEISIADESEVETGSTSNEEVLRQYQVPLALLSPANLRATLAGRSRGGEGARKVTFRVRAGGTADQPDGTALLTSRTTDPATSPSAPTPAVRAPERSLDPHQAHRPGRRRDGRRPPQLHPRLPRPDPKPQKENHHGQRRCTKRPRPGGIPHFEPRRRRPPPATPPRPTTRPCRRPRLARARRARACSRRPPTTSTRRPPRRAATPPRSPIRASRSSRARTRP